MTVPPLVSIVTPSLNQGSFIEATVNSLKRQTYADFEHIVVDGGSTDGTLEILRRYERTYPLRWLSEPDNGMYDAVNKGFRLASGEILCYLNSDDLYFPWTLETVVDQFSRQPGADFLYGDALSIDDASGRMDFYWALPFKLDFIRRYGFLAQPAVFWRRAAFQFEGPFDESLRYVADCEYWMRAGGRRRFAKINEFLAIERDHGATLRSSSSAAVWAELDAVRARYVTLSDRRHERLLRRYAVRQSLWIRLYSLGFLALSLVPLRRGPWKRLISSRTVSVGRMRLLVRAVPLIGRRYAGRVLRPSRLWLEPPSV